MFSGCIDDLLRFFVLVFGGVCLALVLTGAVVGSDRRLTVRVPTSHVSDVDVHISGPGPDLHVDLWRRSAAATKSAHIGAFTVPAQPFAITTILLMSSLILLHLASRISWRRRQL
jgi:hypothetical protein